MEKKRIMTGGVDGGFTELSSEQQSSMKLTRNASGGYGYEIKIYQDDPEKRQKEMDGAVTWIEKFIEEKKKEHYGDQD